MSFRDSKRAMLLILILYLIVGTMEFADETAREKAADVTVVKH